MQDSGGSKEPKWGDSFDLLSDERKRELRDRLMSWIPEQASKRRQGPFAGEHLNGMEVFWIAECGLPNRASNAIVTVLSTLSGFAKVVDQLEGGPVGRMEMNFQCG